MQKKLLKTIVIQLRLVGLLLALCLLILLLFSCNGKQEEEKNHNSYLPINNLPALIYFDAPSGTANAGI